MDMRQLQYFLATVEQKSFGRAAEVMNISQPAISKGVRRLELRLGMDLLERLPRGVKPTPFGEILAEHGRAITRELERAENDLMALQLGQTGKISVGAGSSMRQNLLPMAILRLIEDNPKVEINVVGKLQDGLIPDLRRADIEFAICHLAAGDSNDDLDEFPLYSDEICPVVRIGHPLLSKPDFSVADCLKYPWILPPRDNVGRKRLESLFIALNLPTPHSLIENHATAFSISMITNSDFIGWHPTQHVALHQNEIIRLPVPEVTVRRNVGLVLRKNSSLTTAAKLLINHIKDVAEVMIENGDVLPPMELTT